MTKYSDQKLNTEDCWSKGIQHDSQTCILQDLKQWYYSFDYCYERETNFNWPDTKFVSAINKYQGQWCSKIIPTHSCFNMKHTLWQSRKYSVFAFIQINILRLLNTSPQVSLHPPQWEKSTANKATRFKNSIVHFSKKLTLRLSSLCNENKNFLQL